MHQPGRGPSAAKILGPFSLVPREEVSYPSLTLGCSYCHATTHFNHLAGPGFQIPRFLSVVVVPPAAEDYAVCADDHMRLSTAAYWLSLADREMLPTGEGYADSAVVEVPLANLLTVDTLELLMSGDLGGDTR